MNKPITVAIVDDSADLRKHIMGYLVAVGGFRCEHGFSSADEALSKLPQVCPDVVLMDINLGAGQTDGIECVRRVKAMMPGAQVLMLTVFEDTDKIFSALAAGASGYLLKRMPPAQLLEAIREVIAGGAPMSAPIARKVVLSFQAPPAQPGNEAELSQREREVLHGLAEGLAYKQIAAQLEVSIHTVRSYIRRIYEKLHVRSRTEAVVKYLKH
jgi:DNA-binding NarL/FixJ family response regulator